MTKWSIYCVLRVIIFIGLLIQYVFFYYGILNSSSSKENKLIENSHNNEEWWLSCYYRHDCYYSYHCCFQYLFSSPIIIIHHVLILLFPQRHEWNHHQQIKNNNYNEQQQHQQRLPKHKKHQQQDQLLPLQVFILSGQSNMEGYGSMDHLDLITQSNYNNTIYRDTLWNDTSSTYKLRNDVLMKFGVHSPAGYLTCNHQSGYAGKNCFGPELMFGYTIGDYYLNQKHQQHGHDQQKFHQKKLQQLNILLLKIAWGGKNLAIDYRPPSSGKGNYTNIKPVYYGWEYRQLIQDTIESLNNIPSYVPNYNVTVGYEICGFVWFQGTSDMLDSNMVYEYQSNLIHFIRDVRLDLDTPDLPFVIGELGIGGVNVTGNDTDRIIGIRKAQQNVCLLSEFHNTTSFVHTAPFVVVDGMKYNGEHHYYGRADTYYHIGQELGYGMIDILRKKRNYRNKNKTIGDSINNKIEIDHGR